MKPDPVESYAKSVGAPSFAEFQTSYLVASWFSELVEVHRGARLVGLIPSGVCARLRLASVLTSRRNNKNGVDLELASDLASKPWVPQYKPDPSYIPVVEDHELNTYTSGEGIKSPVESKTLADILPLEEPEPEDEPITHGGHNLDVWMGEDAKLWKTIQETQNDNKRRYRRL